MKGSVNKIRGLRDRGTEVLQALIDSADAVGRDEIWLSELLPSLRGWGAAIQGRFRPLGRISHQEHAWAQNHVELANPKSRQHSDAVYCHAVCMFRLHEFFDRLADAAPLTPESKSGPDRDPRYVWIANETRRLMDEEGYKKRAPALREAIQKAADNGDITAEEAGSAFNTINRHYF